MSQNLKARDYQQNIFLTCIKHNTLVVLPTGLGKTHIAYMLAKYRLEHFKGSKVIIMAPTKPLVEQHLLSFSSLGKVALFNGLIKAEKRAKLFEENDIIIATPQTIQNDLINSVYDLSDVSLMVFDEAHRARGNYAYVFIAKEYEKRANHPLNLALSASPGGNREEILEIVTNLDIYQLEYRNELSPDVKEYVHQRNVKYVEVELQEELNTIEKKLSGFLKEKEKQISDFEHFKGFDLTKRNLLIAQKSARTLIDEGATDYFSLLSIIAQALKVEHAQTLLETQGLNQLVEYFNKLKKEDKSKAAIEIFSNTLIHDVLKLSNIAIEKKLEHPKYDKIRQLVEGNKNKKMIIFTQYRDSAYLIKDMINPYVSCEVFIGQNKVNGRGLRQKDQIALVEKFRNNEIKCLISTSVGEEGLDIPEVDLVIFYEPVPSGIRAIQRRGRTARHATGDILILCTKNTRDERYRWSSHHKEKRMYKILKELKDEINVDSKKEFNLNYFSKPNSKVESNDEKVVIHVDSREQNSNILKNLKLKDVDIKKTQLNIGDYLLSKRCVVEYKTKEDFINSLLDGRLLTQLEALNLYEKPIIIVEGSQDIYSIRNVYPNAIRGLISAITIDFKIPIIYTKNTQDTSDYLYMIAKREQRKQGNTYNPHNKKKHQNIYQDIRYVVSSIPGIGPKLSHPLLTKFKTIKNITNASVKELSLVELIGEKRAKDLYELFNKEYYQKEDE